jgi:flagellum-specific peptidoglycan hydrolase FlgJ
MRPQEKFIDSILPAAVEIQKKYKLPAAALAAQVCLETLYGQKISLDRKTGKNSKNLFNIKGTGPAGAVNCWTQEFYSGRPIRVIAAFRAYANFEQSFGDYVKLITTKTRYKNARAQTDPLLYAIELQRAGYATDPKYAAKIQNIIKIFNIDGKVRKLLIV